MSHDRKSSPVIIDITRDLSDVEFQYLSGLLTKVYELPEYPDYDEDGNVTNTEELTAKEKIWYEDLEERFKAVKKNLEDRHDWFPTQCFYKLDPAAIKSLCDFSYIVLLNLRGELDEVYVKGFEAYYYLRLKFCASRQAGLTNVLYTKSLVEEFGWSKVYHKVEENDKTERWLCESCAGPYLLKKDVLYFQKSGDAVHFKLVWG